VLVLGAVSIGGLWSAGDPWIGSWLRAATAQGAASPTHASPIAITSDNAEVWSVNPDNNSVSVFNVAGDANVKVAEVAVGIEPWCVAITPNNAKVYVANMASGEVKVINRATRAVVKTIKVGTEPFGCALSPDGTKLYVTNQSSDDVSLINTSTDTVIKTIRPVGPKPRGIAVSADGTKVYVTQFLSQSPKDGETRPLTQTEGADDGRVGRVTVLDGVGNRPIKVITLSSFDVSTAFQSDGDTLGREPILTGRDANNNPIPVFNNPTKAFPNLLESIVIRGNLAYVIGTCSSPNGPFRFNVNVQSCVSTIDTTRDAEIKTVNLNDGVNFEVAGETKLFNTNPFALEFKHLAAPAEGFVAIAATNRLLRVSLDAQGLPTINAPTAPLLAGAASPIIRIQLRALDPPTDDPTDVEDPQDLFGGKNPRGLLINSIDTRAYVMDFLSRDVAVVNIEGNDPTKYKTVIRMSSAALPGAGSQDEIVQRGKYLFNTAIGPVGAQLITSKRPAGLMSDTGWGSCYGCHPQALADSVTWMFADGPRQSISMESTFPFGQAVIDKGAPKLPESHQRALNWSAIRDSVQDFERNIRAVSGGGGLIREAGLAEGAAGLVNIPDFLCGAAPSPPCKTPNTGRDPDLDAIATYLALGVRAPISPVSSGVVKKGRALFETAGCHTCHGGANWTNSILDFAPPPAAGQIVDAQLSKFLCRVGTFDAGLFTAPGNEIRANNAANVQARGVLGFNPPSLIAVFNSAPYLHSGAAPTLDAVIDDSLPGVTHRKAGRADGVDTLTDPRDRKALVKFLQSIDRTTAPFLNPPLPPAGACGP
jgi:YVTN family beta-propeller protein